MSSNVKGGTSVKHPQKPKVVVEWSKHSEPRHGAQCACTASPQRLCPSLNLAVWFFNPYFAPGHCAGLPLNADVQKEYKRYHIDIINIIYIYNDYIIYILVVII